MNKPQKIGIIGCGISGLSVAYVLLEKGFEVTLLSKHDPQRTEDDPIFASLYPAASIIPHSVNGPQMDSLFKESQHFFDRLYEQDFPGLSQNLHFELFAHSMQQPDYSALVNEFTSFAEFRNDFYPHHPNVSSVDGWRFRCFFTDWPIYYPALFAQVMKNGASLNITEVTPESLPDLPFDIIINCGGLEGAVLFGDDNDLLYRGFLLSVKNAPKLTHQGHTISYNFSPGTDIYATNNGNGQDVYCYPREDGWILGGSRQKGSLDADRKWLGDEADDPTLEIDGTELPSQILTLNAEIIEHSFGVKADIFPERSVKMGYRFVRKDEGGLRLEAEEKFGKRIIHNYGHGGAGVTLSWGCALKVAEMLGL